MEDLFYGGAAGGGKSDALLMGALQYVDVPNYAALLLRRTYPDLSQPGALMDRAHQWLDQTDAVWNGNEHRWYFPSGATVTFGYLSHYRDKYRYQGAEYQYVGFDEATQFQEEDYKYLFSRIRKNKSMPAWLPLRLRAASNPGDIGHEWVKRHYINPKTRAPGSVFIAANIEDNPYLDLHEYEKMLARLDPVERARLRRGDWDIVEEGELFKRRWFPRVDRDAVPHDARYIRYWDLAATRSYQSGDPDYTVGVLMAEKNGRFWIVDVVRFRGSPGEVETAILTVAEYDGDHVPIHVEQEGGAPIWEEEPVMMSDGSYLPLKDVQVGDSVISGMGRPCEVSAVYEQGDLPVVKITADSGRSIRAALDHPFLTPSGWVDAADLEPGMHLGLPTRPAANSHTERTPEEFRLAGYFIGDGSCGPAGRGGNSPLSSIACWDRLQREDIAHCVDALGFSMREDGPRENVLVIKDGVKQWLRDTGLAGKRSHDKVVPDWVFHAPPEMIAQFIGAYFACDGTVSKGRNAKGIEFYSVSRELLEGVQSLLLRLGIASRLSLKSGNYKNNRHSSWRLSIAQKTDAEARFAERIPVKGKKAALLEGKPRGRFDGHLIADRIVSVQVDGTAPCRCLTVEEDSTFLVRDAVVHNSGKIVAHHYRTNVLPGFAVKFIPSRQDKSSRAKPLSSAAEAGNVALVRARWNEPYLDELTVFPAAGFHDDQVDASSGAHIYLSKQRRKIRVSGASRTATRGAA